MPLQDALDSLLANTDKLWVVQNQDGNFWRTTLANTRWVKLRWGTPPPSAYIDEKCTWELHVHSHKQNVVPGWQNAEPAICGAGLKCGKKILSQIEWLKLKDKVKTLVDNKD